MYPGKSVHIISFAYDDVTDRPELCMTLLRMVMSRYHADSAPVGLHSLAERETIRLACTLGRPLRPIDVERHLRVNHRKAVGTLQSLCDKGWFTPVTRGAGKYIVRYELRAGALDYL